MILIITRLTINGVIMIACHQITRIARSLHQVVIRWCSRVQRRWQRWSHWILANKKSDASQEKSPLLQLRKSCCSHRLGFLDQQGWKTRNDKYIKSSVNLQLIALYYYVSRMEGALKNDQEHQTINQECTKCSAKISICWSAPHDGSLSGAEDVRILRAPPPKTSTLPQLDEPQHNSRCTQTEKAQAPKAALLLFKTQLDQEFSSSAKATASDNQMWRRKDVE